MDLVNLFNQTSYVDLIPEDLVSAVYEALSYNELVSRDQVLKAFGKIIHSQDRDNRNL